jgi:hypothetical protein
MSRLSTKRVTYGQLRGQDAAASGGHSGKTIRKLLLGAAADCTLAFNSDLQPLRARAMGHIRNSRMSRVEKALQLPTQ